MKGMGVLKFQLFSQIVPTVYPKCLFLNRQRKLRIKSYNLFTTNYLPLNYVQCIYSFFCRFCSTKQLESDDWTVDMVSIDECIPNDCIRECSSVLTIEETPILVNTPEFSFVSVNSYEVAECSCAVKSTPIGGCLSTTCRNGGTCILLDSGDVGYTWVSLHADSMCAWFCFRVNEYFVAVSSFRMSIIDNTYLLLLRLNFRAVFVQQLLVKLPSLSFFNVWLRSCSCSVISLNYSVCPPPLSFLWVWCCL